MIRNPARRALTFVEVMIATAIALPVTFALLATMILVMRIQATCADQARTRVMAEMAVNRMLDDIRNTSAQAYRNPLWPKVTGASQLSPQMELTLLDSATGLHVVWTFDRTTHELTRTTRNLSDPNSTTTRTYIGKFTDMMFEERRHQDSQSSNLINGIRITGRSFLSITPRNSIWNETDGNGDGDFRNDQVGETYFGRSDDGDDPVWQYIFNVEVSFRNT